ncbi:hypothetical protein CH375_08955 [Leptospira ellisii]|nr:hypothetical protein CH375_08955 [Leptospira ellisii]
MGKKEIGFEKRHNLKIKEADVRERENRSETGKILPFPRARLWNSEKIRKLCEKLFFS